MPPRFSATSDAATAAGEHTTTGRQPLLAGGQPISSTVADAAAAWLTLLMSGEATDEDRKRWQQWRSAHPDHERTWQHIESVTTRLKGLRGDAAYKSLSPMSGQRSRRKLLGTLLWVGAAGIAGAFATRSQTWREMTADYRTGVGERREVLLADGTWVTLNTRSAIDVRFDAQRRLVRLVAGEVLVATRHEPGEAPDPRAFVVDTAEGRIRALGTRFTVQQSEGCTLIAVFEGAVEIAPADAAAAGTLMLRAGERSSFTRGAIEAPTTALEQSVAWARGQIIADDVRLGDFIADIGRYRSGVLRCDPAVSDLRLSGVFPLDDTDRILETLPSVLPVRLRPRTRYWITVEAR